MRPAPRPRRRRAVIAASLLAAATLWPHTAAAEGALAVGLPRDVAAEGFAYGFAVDRPNAEEWNAKALSDGGTRSQGGGARGQALCAVVQTFHDQCFAVA